MTPFISKCGVVLGAVFVLCISSVASAAQKSELIIKEVVNVGIYAPFSNQSAMIGRSMLGAMEIARDQLKSSEIHYEFYTLDSASENAHNPAILQKFIEANNINVLVTEGNANGALAAPLAKKNNLIHFCLANNTTIADGKNNFMAQSPHHKHAATLTTAMNADFVSRFQQEYFNNPVTEAGYAYDIFQLLNNSTVIAMKSKKGFSSQVIADNLIALQSGKGLLGSFNFNKKGLAYA